MRSYVSESLLMTLMNKKQAAANAAAHNVLRFFRFFIQR